MNDTTQRAWALFANGANWTTLHTLDLGRFAEFVKAGHDDGVDRPDFEALVAEHVTDEDVLAEATAELDSLWDFGTRVAALCDAERGTAPA